MAGIRLQGPYSQVINRYGKPDSKTTVDVSYNTLGLKGELNAASRIWVLHTLEPNKPVTKSTTPNTHTGLPTYSGVCFSPEKS